MELRSVGIEAIRNNIILTIEECSEELVKIKESKQRVLSMFDKMKIEYDKEEAMKIMDHNPCLLRLLQMELR